MRIRFVLAVAVTLIQPFAVAQQPRPLGKGKIDVQVTRVGTTEGIPDVAVTLQAPAVTADQVRQMFTPSASLTPAERLQVDSIIEKGIASSIMAPIAIANAAAQLQAQLLGQPAPPSLPTPPGFSLVKPPDLTLVTDADGRVSFSSLPPGRYTILAQRQGYYGAAAPVPAGGTYTIEQGTITLKENDEAPATLAFVMMRSIVIGGRVRDPEDRPAVGVIVTALQKVYQGGRAVLKAVSVSTSDDRGVYRMFWLPPGDYYLSATPRGRSALASPQETWTKTYFPGVVEARMAAPVTAAEGAELSVDITVQADATRRIAGRIVNPFKDANGKTTPTSTTLYLIPRDPPALSDGASLSFLNVALDRSNGEFEIRGVLPGVYDVLASAPTGAAATPLPSNAGITVISAGNTLLATAWGRTRVDVGKEDVANVIVTIKEGIEVKVRVAVDGAPPLYTLASAQRGIGPSVVNELIARGVTANDAIVAGARASGNAGPLVQIPTPRVRLGLAPKETSDFFVAASQVTFDPSGLYVFPSVPQGSYRVQVVAPQESYVADIRLGSTSIYDDGLVIDGPLPGEIEIAVVSRGGQIEGAVTNVESQPTPNVLVALVPAQSRRQNPALYKAARTNATGGFSLSGVAPGAYKLFAWEDVPETAWANAEFLSRYEPLGEDVTVMGGESVKATLKMIPKDYGR